MFWELTLASGSVSLGHSHGELRRKVLVAVVLVSLTFHPDAVMVELRRRQDGWFVWFVRPPIRQLSPS
jgi:hypothetical protein